METDTLPENLKPAVKVGDVINRLVRLEGGGWFWGPAVAVRWIGSDGAVYVRYRHGKVDKMADEYRLSPNH